MNTLKILFLKLSLAAAVFAVCALAVTTPTLAACSDKVGGLCESGIACPFEDRCCSNTDECTVGEGNLDPEPDDPAFTPQGARDEISRFIDADPTLVSPGAILSALLPYLFVFAGLILLTMLIWGGFEMLGGATNPKSSENGKNRITAALKGFLLLFVAIWIAQLAQTILGINILNN